MTRTRIDVRATARSGTAWIALLVLASGCAGPPGATAVYAPWPGGKTVAPLTAPIQLYLGRKQSGWVEFALDGGQLEFEVYNSYRKIALIARNRYAAPVVLRWKLPLHENLDSPRPLQGIALLPAAATPFGDGAPVLLSQLQWVDLAQGYQVRMQVDFSFGDPVAEPAAYSYGLPYPAGLAFRVGQGFRGAQTHTGANEFAVDFNCPVGTPVLAMRPGVVLVTNASALYGGTTSYHLDWKQGNFVLLLHDDGTIAHYVHLAPDGVLVKAGQRLARGEQLGISGETGFATGPHLHVDISTRPAKGMPARSRSVSPSRRAATRSRSKGRSTRPGRCTSARRHRARAAQIATACSGSSVIANASRISGWSNPSRIARSICAQSGWK